MEAGQANVLLEVDEAQVRCLEIKPDYVQPTHLLLDYRRYDSFVRHLSEEYRRTVSISQAYMVMPLNPALDETEAVWEYRGMNVLKVFARNLCMVGVLA